MNRLSGIPTLNAGAPDLRLSGDQTQRGTYVQRRRAQMAGGGITNARQGYFLGGITDFIADLIPNEIKDPIAKIIPNELKNPIAAAVAANYLPKIWDGDTLLSRLPEGVTDVIDRGKNILLGDVITTGPQTGQREGGLWGLGQDVLGGIGKYGLGLDKDPNTVNWQIPLLAGKFAHDYQRDYLAKQPAFPGDETSINFQTAAEAMADPNLRFKPQAQYANVAEGGRIGYEDGGIMMASGSSQDDMLNDLSFELFGKPVKELTPPELREFWEEVQRLNTKVAQGGRIGYAGGKYLSNKDWLISKGYSDMMKGMSDEDIIQLYDSVRGTWSRAQGGRIGAQEGGLMDLGGMEKDYRQEGGFVPIGGEEKADDVPARLSKNEFVFTADAVRSAGGGDIDEGAAVMERLMENLEAGGKVSEDSQGLEGAQEMFANTQRLQNRII